MIRYGGRLAVVMTVALVCFAVALLVFGGWLFVRNFRECRAHGFSALYCATTQR